MYFIVINAAGKKEENALGEKTDLYFFSPHINLVNLSVNLMTAFATMF